MRLAAVIFLILLLLPTASALTIVTVASTLQMVSSHTPAGSDTYSFSLASTVFTAPIFQATVEAAADFGTVTVNHVVHYRTDWSVADDNGISTAVSVQSYGEKKWTGTSQRQWTVFVNGTGAWYIAPQTVGVAGAAFDYEDSHILQYAENVSAYVPRDCDTGALYGDWATAAPLVHNSVGPAGRCVERVTVARGLFYILADFGEEAFGTRNTTDIGGHEETKYRYWLANVTSPDAWTFNTTYQDRVPSALDIVYRFETQASKAERVVAEDDGCNYPRIKDFIGFCPTLAGVAAKTASFFPTLVGSVLGLVEPSWGDFFKLFGDIAGEFVGAYFFTLTLLAADPGKLFVLIVVTGSGVANLVGAVRGDVGTIFWLHYVIFKSIAIAVFWYFYVYWVLLQWALKTAVTIFDMLAKWADALIPIP